MMKKVSAFLIVNLALIWVSLSALATYTDDELWAMLKTAESNEAFKDDSALIIFDEVTSTFRPDGANVSTLEFFVRIQDETVVREFSTLSFHFNQNTSNIFFEEVKIFRGAEKKVETLPLEAVQTLMAPDDWLILWNFQIRLLTVGRLNEGDALYYRVRRKGLNLAYLRADDEERDYLPPMPGHFFDVVYFEAEHPMLRKKYCLVAPKEKPVQYELANGEVKSSIRFQGEKTEYTWSKENIPAYEEEKDSSSFNDTAIKLVVATNPDWEGKSRWAYEVNEPQFVISEEMRKKVDELTRGLKSDHEKMAALLHWVAENVRYLGLDMGEGEGFTVHRTDDIFRDRAGVCKDKAACLVSMLRSAGFKTYFVLTLAMEKAEDIPADQFNHGVVAVLQKDGSFIYLDPTWAGKNRALFNALEQEQPILVATEKGEDLSSIPYSPPEDNYWYINSETLLKEDGSVSMVMKVQGDGYGGSKMREAIAYRTAPEIINYFYEIVYPISARARINEYTYRDPLDFEKPMDLSLSATIPDYFFTVGERHYFVPPLTRFPFSRRWESDFLYSDGPEKRKRVMEVSSTLKMVFNEDIILPAHFSIKELPEAVSIDNPAASLNYKAVTKGRKLNITMEIILKKRKISPDEYPEFRAMIKKIKELQNRSLALVDNDRKN